MPEFTNKVNSIRYFENEFTAGKSTIKMNADSEKEINILLYWNNNYK